MFYCRERVVILCSTILILHFAIETPSVETLAHLRVIYSFRFGTDKPGVRDAQTAFSLLFKQCLEKESTLPVGKSIVGL